MFGHYLFENPSHLARYSLRLMLKVIALTILPMRYSTPPVLDLISKMITWDPDRRLTVIEALEHPWLANYRA